MAFFGEYPSWQNRQLNLSKIANRKGFGDLVHNDDLDQDLLLFDFRGIRHGKHHSAYVMGGDSMILSDIDPTQISLIDDCVFT